MADEVVDGSNLDAVDRTPVMTRVRRAKSEQAYPNDDCIKCGRIVHMGFFFDGFARSRDLDDPATSRYSNICRLWEAHRENEDERRGAPEYKNQLWYRFYYSGLGTALNDEATKGDVGHIAWKGAVAAAGAVGGKLKGVPAKVTNIDHFQLDPEKTLTDAFKKGLTDFSVRPVVKVFDDTVKTVQKMPREAVRVFRIVTSDRIVDRGRAVMRKTLYEAATHPWKAGWELIKGAAIGYTLDTIPWFRDNRAIAALMGTGVEDRVSAALRQFDNAYKDAKQQCDKLQRIQISVFGADRGAVIARVFVNELVKKYKRRDAADLAIDGVQIEIKFMGLFDAVSSIMEENKLLSAMPVLDILKQNFGDLSLAVPEAVQRCVHMAAAHELRFYQRLDSLEKTRGEQYLYPGTSEDVTGGAPAGSLGARTELMRVPLRDMLNSAYEAGVAIDSMELLFKHKPRLFSRFSMAARISDGSTPYTMPQLVKAYQKLVPYKQGLDFLSHMEVFLRWLAVRYQSPAFRASVTSAGDQLKAEHQRLLKEKQDAEAAYIATRNRLFSTTKQIVDAQIRFDNASAAEDASLRKTTLELSRPTESVWERLQRESNDMVAAAARQDGLKKSKAMLEKVGAEPWGLDTSDSAKLIDSAMMDPNQLALANAWSDATAGKHPLPAEIMALFDFLVHDTMLTSWHDHLLSGPLYFQTRATDTFGSTDFAEEKKQRERDDRRSSQIDRITQVTNSSIPTAR